MATFTTLAKKFFYNVMAAGLGEIFIKQKFSCIQHVLECKVQATIMYVRIMYSYYKHWYKFVGRMYIVCEPPCLGAIRGKPNYSQALM